MDQEKCLALEELKIKVKKIEELENLEHYLTWQYGIENISQILEATIFEEGLEMKTIGEFIKLRNIWSVLKESRCTNLVKFCKDTVIYWYTALKERFQEEFEVILKALNWPNINVKVAPDPIPEMFVKFKKVFENLLAIELSDDLQLLEDVPRSLKLTLPIQIMIEPIQKRYLYHFMSNKKTNRYDKPEWYMTQVLMWINGHVDFLEEHVQPLLDNSTTKSIPARDQLVSGLVQLCIDKLNKDMPHLLANDYLLTHTIDEVIVFAQEINKLDFPSHHPSVIDVISANPCFTQWKRLERQTASNKMNELLNNTTAWDLLYKDRDIDDFKIPECAESFMTLLKTLGDHYQVITKPLLQLEFLQVQVDLLEDFRIRLYQRSYSDEEDSRNSNAYPILNTIYYIITILGEWDCQCKFIYLQHIKERFQETQATMAKFEAPLSNATSVETHLRDNSVFENTISSYEDMLSNLLKSLWRRIFLDIKAKSREYRNEKWFYLPIVENLEASASIFPMLLVLKTYLQKLEEDLAKDLFEKTWKQVARDLDEYIFEDIILESSFNEGGARQLQFDINRCMLPLFGTYSHSPELYFKKVKDACILLTQNHGTTLLLKEALKSHPQSNLSCPEFEELGIFNYSLKEAQRIISLRIDVEYN